MSILGILTFGAIQRLRPINAKVHVLRGATDRDRWRRRLSPPAGRTSAQSWSPESREQPQRRVEPPAAQGMARDPEALAPGALWSLSYFASSYGAAVRAIFPRPQRRGLPAPGQSVTFVNATTQFCPPNPNAFATAACTGIFLASSGT